MTRLITLLGTLLAGTAAGLAQNNAIPWQTDAAAAVAQAQQLRRPLMCYVLASERYRDDQLDRDQKRAFRDPRIIRKSQRFVPLRLSRAQNRERLEQFGFREHSNMEVSFVTPTGNVLAVLSASDVGNLETLSRRMTAALDSYGTMLYEAEIKPKLSDERAKPDELKQGLRLISDLRIKAADKGLVELLDRARLDGSVRKLAIDALAGLSTPPAVTKLLESARANDAVAAKALEQCTPAAAELLVKDLKPDAQPFDYLVYKTVVRICKIPKPMPERFFENANEMQREAEVKRVSDAVTAAAEQWKAAND